MNDSSSLKLILPEDLDEQDLFEMRYKGWFSAEVEMIDGRRFSVSFFDPVRLQQTIVDVFQLNLPCLAEVGLVILPEVTIERIQQSLEYLHEIDFFQRQTGHGIPSFSQEP